jgi:protein-S-isoprenylcysteine O-methyltransferase Ste14
VTHRFDLGRLTVVPVISVLIVANAMGLVNGWQERGWLASLGTAAALTFYVVLAWQYIRRPLATRTDRRPLVWLVAFLATASPFLVPLAGRNATGSEAAVVVGSVVILAGICGAIWATASLGRNFSIVPQARGVADHGPYRYFRHPLYLFEIISAAGLALVVGGVGPWLVVAAMTALQMARARWEEQLLRDTLPGYAEYSSRTPGLWPVPQTAD